MATFINIFIVAAVLITTVFGQNYNTNRITNGTQNYFRIAQAELLIKIKLAEMENDAVDTRFLDRLAVIELHQQQVLNATQQVNQTIIPLQALSIARKYCIQTYDSQFITHQSVKDQFKQCNSKVQNLGESLTSSAKSTTKSAKNYAINTLSYNLKTCQPYNLNYNQTKIEECFIGYVEKAVEYVQGNLDSAQFYREQSIFDMNAFSLSAVQCSFGVEKVVLETITLTSKKIDDCVNDLQKKTNYGSKNSLK